MMRSVLTRGLWAVLVASVLGACVSLVPDAGPPPDVYRLTRPAIAPGDQSVGTWAIQVPRPVTARALATDRLVIVKPDQTIAYAAGARWEAAAPDGLQSLLIAHFHARGEVAAVRPDDGVSAPYELRLELHAFEARYAAGMDEAPTAVVRLDAKLVDNGTRSLVGVRSVLVEHAASSAALPSVIAALDAATNEAAGELASWAAQLEVAGTSVTDEGGDMAPSARRAM